MKGDIQLQALHTIIRLNEIFGYFATELKDLLTVAIAEVTRLFSADYCDILISDEGQLKGITQLMNSI